MNFRPLLFGLLLIVAMMSARTAVAQVPASATYFPATTKLYISVPQPDDAREQFDATQLGKLVNHPAMEKFNDDLSKQLEGQGRLAERLGVALGDLEDIAGGEIALAVIRPEGEKDGYATALVIDVTGNLPAAQKMLVNVQARRKKDKGVAHGHMFGKQRGIEYKMPKKDKQPAFSTFITYTTTKPMLIIADHEQEAHAIFDRIEGTRKDSLGQLPAFQGAMAHVEKASGGLSPDVRWFVEPFGYMRLRRSEQIDAGVRKPIGRGKEDLDVYADEGFDAVEGAGGWIHFGEAGHEMLHRTFVYAPPVNRMAKDELTLERLKIEAKTTPPKVKYAGPDNDKYFLGARMMSFFNKDPQEPIAWIPTDLAVHMTFNWHMQRAFKYSETLVNGLAREVGGTYWSDTLDSIQNDIDGPKVNLRKDIAAQLGDRAIYISDNHKPIDPKSERTVLAFEITGDVALVQKALDGMMANDPDGKLHKVGDKKVWELMEPPPARRDRGGRRGGAGGAGGAAAAAGGGGAGGRQMPASAFAVAHGYLLRGSHPDIVKRLLEMPKMKDSLAGAADLKKVNLALDKFTDGNESFRYFERLDRSLEGHWELTRQNKFPQSESMLANLVAQMQGLDPEDEETRKRKQDIDGTNLPKFDFATEFLGPAGLIVKSEQDGWLVTGAVLTKE